ncbi:alpha-2-macroglobulin domain protein [Leptonema illini DSM 21528]|uniref:Alpha-2-macroglobulin domain protein n=2 Tax=Leptonema illini TaxID=183 RepID=H2CDV1_9LEPT|nr:alpha-2-macroglobulin domain protein [Leptonema illini DSM 21528]
MQMKNRLAFFSSSKSRLLFLIAATALGGFAFFTAKMEAQTPPGYLPEPDIDSNSLQVIQAVPAGQLPSTAAKEIVVSFNQALIPLGKVDSSDLKPFRIEPEISGRFRWYGSSVAAFLPDGPLKAGTHYTIIVPAGLKDLQGRALKADRTFSFHTEALKVDYMYPSDGVTVDYTPSIRVRFNLPVDPSTAKPFVEMRAGNTTVPVELEGPDADQYIGDDDVPQQHMRIRPARPLPRGAQVTLVLKKGLPISGQEGGLAQEFTRKYQTYGPVSVTFEDEAKFFQDSYETGLRFNNEIDPVQAHPFIRLYDEKNNEIKIPEPDERYSTSFISASSWPVKPGKSYRVFVRRGLPDVYGNALPAEKDFRFRMPAVRPFLTLNAGWGASEAMLSPRIPYRYGNMKEVRVEVAPIGLDAILAFLDNYKNDPHKKLNFKKIPLPVNAGPEQVFTRQFDFSSFLNVNRPDGKNEKKTGWIAYRFEGDVLDWEGNKEKASFPGILQSTDLGLTVRESPFAAHVWVHSLSNGEALPGTLVRQYDGSTKGGTCETDKNGYCRIEKASPSLGDKTLYLALDRRAGHGGDMAFVTARFDRVYSGVQWGSHRAGLPEIRGMLVFDRKLYRPGETVQFKAVLSVLERGNLMPFKAGDVRVSINDSRGRQIYSKILKPTAQGGVYDAVRIPENSPLGHYNISVVPNMFVGRKAPDSMGGVWDNFQVEEFRPLTFTVLASGTEDRLQSSPAPVRVEGRYLFGAPMSQARASVVVYERAASIYLNQFPAFETGDPENSIERIHLRGQGRLDNAGAFTMQMPAGSFESEKRTYLLAAEYEKARKGNVISLVSTEQRTLEVRPHRKMRLEAKVFDASNRSVTKNAEYTHYASAVFPAVRPVRYVFEENKDASVEVLFVDIKGQAAPGRGEVYVFRNAYNVVETKGPSGSLQRINSLVRILEGRDSIEASGPKVYTFRPTKPGSYEILVRTGDGAFAQTTVYVSGKGYGYWWGSGDDSVELIADKRQYRPGDTARILIKSPYEKAKAVITVEREDILDRRVIEMTSSSQSVDIPLKAEYIPGVQISVMIFRPRVQVSSSPDEADPGKPAVKMGTLYVDLATDTKRIPVAIKKSCDPCGPGQEMQIDIKTAPGAEVALDVADRAILDLVGYRFADPVSRFYDARPYGIRVLDIRGSLIDQFLRAGKGEPGGGGDESSSGGFALDGEDGMRKNFRYTAEWKPVLVADAGGKITLKFRLPDNLTTFRIMALAAKDGLYGKAEEEFRVQKSVVTMPVLPNFVRPGDGIWAGALVINQTGAKSDFVFEFQSSPALCAADPSGLNGKEPIPQKLTKEVSLAAGETREILFYCKIPRSPSFLKDLRKEKVDPMNPSFRLDAGSIAFSFRAKGTGDIADGMSRSVPLRQEVVREAFTVSGGAVDTAEEGLLVPDPDENPGELSLQMSGTALLGLKSGYDFFALNPYLCLEQRTSATVVHVMAGPFAPTKTGGEYDPARLNDLFYGSLPSFQNEDGGLRLWKELESSSDPYLTAYVLEALTKLPAPAAYKGRVDAIVPRALSYLVAYRDNPRRETRFYQIETMTYLNYVLSLYGRGRADLVKSALAESDKLSLRGRGYALLTAHGMKVDTGPAANRIIDDFKNRLSFSTRKIELRETLPFSASRIYYSSGSTLGVWIRYLTERNLHPDFVSKMVLGAANRNVFQSSSHDEAALAMAIRRYHEVYEKGIPTGVAVSLDGKDLFKADFDAKSPLLSTSVDTEALIKRFSLKNLDKPKSLKIMNPSKQGRVYYNATLDYAVDFTKIQAKDEGIYITREVLDERMKPVSLKGLRRGDVYPVRLRIITRRPIANFLLRDPIASATEIVNTSFQTEGLSLADLERTGQSDYPWFGSGEIVEKRYDAYIVTDPYLSAGVHEYIYLVRPIQAGRTLLPPAQAQAMYEPEIFGRTDGGAVEATK